MQTPKGGLAAFTKQFLTRSLISRHIFDTMLWVSALFAAVDEFMSDIAWLLARIRATSSSAVDLRLEICRGGTGRISIG